MTTYRTHDLCSRCDEAITRDGRTLTGWRHDRTPEQRVADPLGARRARACSSPRPPVRRCHSLGELMDADMRIIPGITLPCMVELYDGALDHAGAPHQHTLTWGDPTAAELAEVLDPDESFDLEVDIAPAEVIEHQARVTADAEPVEPLPLVACSVCGRELVLLGPAGRHGWAHLTGPTPEHPWHEASPA